VWASIGERLEGLFIGGNCEMQKKKENDGLREIGKFEEMQWQRTSKPLLLNGTLKKQGSLEQKRCPPSLIGNQKLGNTCRTFLSKKQGKLFFKS
jgi:hypothetical protein